MPASIIGEVVGGALKFIGEIILRLVFEILIQGSGHIILRILNPKKQPSDTASTLMGLLFWLIVGILVFYFMR